MPLDTIEYKGKEYLKLQSEGFASQYAFAFAKQVCKGNGLDIGYGKEEWKFPDAFGIENKKNGYNAYNLPKYQGDQWDYIFSSHCLEHLDNWVEVLDYWQTCLKEGGVLFLYLPHYNQEYWRSWNNKKHIHNLDPQVMEDYFHDRKWKKVFVTKGFDLNNSFYCVCEK